MIWTTISRFFNCLQPQLKSYWSHLCIIYRNINKLNKTVTWPRPIFKTLIAHINYWSILYYYNNSHTNWTPVSLRTPMPAEAKLAPTNNLSPLSSGLKYGNVDSDPSSWPANINHKLTYTIWHNKSYFFLSKPQIFCAQRQFCLNRIWSLCIISHIVFN